MYMRIPELNLNFKDSLCFLPMAMRQFPGTFGLTVEKGYFPHFFNGPENQNYRGPLPPLETYGYRSMAPKPAQELKEWYDEEVRRGRVFDFETDLLKYCRQDVLVLMRGGLEGAPIVLPDGWSGSLYRMFYHCVVVHCDRFERIFWNPTPSVSSRRWGTVAETCNPSRP